MELIFYFLLMGIVAGLNVLPMQDTLNFRISLFRFGIGAKIFDILSFAGVIASIALSIKLFIAYGFIKLTIAFILVAPVGYGFGNKMARGRFGGILPITANILLTSITILMYLH
jgi:hypothetical protein